jgi:hypothetical protein
LTPAMTQLRVHSRVGMRSTLLASCFKERETTVSQQQSVAKHELNLNTNISVLMEHKTIIYRKLNI